MGCLLSFALPLNPVLCHVLGNFTYGYVFRQRLMQFLYQSPLSSSLNMQPFNLSKGAVKTVNLEKKITHHAMSISKSK